MYNKVIIPLLFSFFLLSQVSFGQAQWYVQNSNSNRELTGVSFIDENTGWISGWTGTVLKTTDGGQTWNALPNVPPNNAYYSISFTDAMNGWATGYSGKIIHTTDGGQSWTNESSPVNTDLYDVYFLDSQKGWIAGGDAGSFPSNIDTRVIFSTTNGGTTWNAQYYQTYKARLNSIYFLDESNGYATGLEGVLMRTSNGGTSWTEQTINASFSFFDVFFTNNNTGYVVGEDLNLPHHSSIFKTTDGGNNWNETSLGMDEVLTGVYFTNDINGWAVGEDYGNSNIGIVYHTTDAGSNWVSQNIPSVEALFNVFFVDGTKGWAVGHLGTIIEYESQLPVELASFNATTDEYNVTLAWATSTETNNSGFEILRSVQNENWEDIDFIEGHGTTTQENNYSYVDENLGTGSYSYKLVQIDFDGTRNESNAVSVEINFQPAEYILAQNYPNPFNPTTTIEYSIPESGIVKLQVYNSIGKEIKTLVNGFEAAGSHGVEFSSENLASGIYFYKIDAGKFSSIKKMILLK